MSIEKIARTEPYYCVLSQPQYLSSRIAGSRGAFFDSGEREVEQLVQSLRSRHSATPVDVLEYGCGPGRLIPALSRRGFRVTAVDRSPAMLALARENAAQLGAANVDFVQLETFEQQTAPFDLVIVSRVLQHSSVADGLAALRMLVKRVTTGGFLYLNVPFHSTRGRLSRSALWLRRALPPLNAVANRMRGRPSNVPVIVPVVYPIDDVLLALHEGGCEIDAFDVEQENELTTAHLVARKSRREAAAFGGLQPRSERPDTPLPEDYISPADLIRDVGLAELNARAERYFAGSDDWTQQLAKPFSNPADAPEMLVSLGVVLRGLSLVPGMTVLDFGGGTGWLSRFLLQFGCRVVLCDVSQSALNIAKNFVERHPPVGGNAEDLSFSLFDGERIDLGDESVDRILCFDSFHHVPNMEAALAEFARILRPGAIAAFSEPGPEHSRSAQSQFEMRVHGVLENDVDVRRIWRIARESGFDDLRLLAFNGAPAPMTLDEFDDFLEGGPQLQVAARALRDFTGNVRTFTLRRAGIEKSDSRVAAGLSADIEITLDGSRFTARITNTGTAEWLPSAASPGGVSLGAHLHREGKLVDFNFLWADIGEGTVTPNETVIVHGSIPALPSGRVVIEFDCVARGVAWFAQTGSRPARVEMNVV